MTDAGFPATRRLAFILIFLISLFSVGNSPFAEDNDDDRSSEFCAVEVDPIPNFTDAEVLERVRGKYPREEESQWSEGWVNLLIQVKADDSVGDVLVTDSLGADSFVKRAVGAVKKWKYRAAKLNGKPIDSYAVSLSYVYLFQGPNRFSWHDGPARKFRRAQDLMKERKFEEAITLLDKAFDQPANLYEQAMVSALMAESYLQLGNRRMALIKIRHASYNNGAYVNKDMARAVMRMRIHLAAQEGDFSDALCTYERLKSMGLTDKGEAPDAKPVQDVEKVLAVIKNALGTPKALAVEATIFPSPDGEANWNRSMLRKKFAFDVVKGSLDRFKLICSTVQMEEKYDPAMEWTIPKEAGFCMVFVYGTPGTVFKFIERD